MDTLLDLLPRIRELGTREAVRFSDGLRSWVSSYADLYDAIGAVARFLDERHVGKGDRLILWCENRPEWLSVFWAALSRGVEVVPIDAQTGADRVARIQEEVRARLLVSGAHAASAALPVETLRADDVRDLPRPERFTPGVAHPDDIVEILYTSGTTAEPKGVIHRHRNITANLTPVAREIARYRKWARPFQPVRILNMLPFSHMFGQSMGVFIPPLLGGSVVLMTEKHPGALCRAIRRERVSVLVGVPRLLASLETEMRRRHPYPDPRAGLSVGAARRWWRYRAVHRDLGWKFWAFVVGGAELPRPTEEYWAGLGFAVVQGYGLTETSPVVSVNHPFHSRRGTLGRVLGSQEVRIAPDGEILVRGPSVVSEYLGSGAVRKAVTDAEGWLHTGDIGRIEADGRLVFRGRKKDVIVLPDGYNVYPEDVEGVLNKVPGVRDAAVVSLPMRGEERVHAVLILEEDAPPQARIIEEANRRLEPQQRIRSWSLWEDREFPRTASTLKIQRHKVAARVREGQPSAAPLAGPRGEDVRDIVAEVTGRPLETLSHETTLGEELGLSSLERVDMQALLEERYDIDLDEGVFSGLSTIGELEAHVESHRRQARHPLPAHPGPGAPAQDAGEPTSGPRAPRWTRSVPVGLFRRGFQAAVIQPLLAPWVRVEAAGLENLPPDGSPVIFASTHHSHFDVPVLLRALPPSWRRRIAPAMLQEYFFAPSGWVLRCRAVEYYLVLAVFNAYPLPQRPGRIRNSLEYTGELVSAGHCPLVFPEGRRGAGDTLQPFHHGIGFMAVHLRTPVVPVRIHGLSAVLPVGARWPRRGTVRVLFGPALEPQADDSYAAFTSRLEARMRAMF